jgi:hypothetical protein
VAEISRLVSGNSIERLLDKIDGSLSNSLIFTGVLDNNAKLLSFRRGKARFSLPIERHDTLDVQLSLMFSLIRQLEDISGDHKFTVTRFARHDIFLSGTSDLHIFVITSPTPDGQIAKTLAEMVAIMNDAGPPMATSTLAARTKDQTMAAAVTSTIHNDESGIDRQRFSSSSKPESISILQGYLMALETGISIQDDSSGYYKIKSNESDQFAWSTLERISSTFKDRIVLHNVGQDADGKVFVRISLK